MLGVLLVCALGLPDSRADTRADESRRTRAARLYAAAEQTALTGDYARAAEMFEQANQLVPSPQAMRSAIRSHVAAGQHRAAITRAEDLLRRYPYDQRSRALAIETIDQHSSRFVRVYVTCREACRLRIDGEASAAPAHTHLAYLPPGKHEIVARFANRTEVTRVIDRGAGEPMALVFDLPGPPGPRGRAAPAGRDGDAAVEQSGEPGAGVSENPRAPADAAQASAVAASAAPALRPPRLPLIMGGAVTLAVGTAMVWSYQDTIAAEQAPGTMPDSLDARRRRTGILLGATAVSAVATMALAVIGAQRAHGGEAPGHGRERPALGMLVDGETYWIGMARAF